MTLINHINNVHDSSQLGAKVGVNSVTKSSTSCKKHIDNKHDSSQLLNVNNVTTRSEAYISCHNRHMHDSSLMGASELSDTVQCDGADTTCDLSSNDSDDTEGDTEDEAYADREAAVLVPAPAQPGARLPPGLEVDESGRMVLPASLPLVMLTNARSVYNKIDNFKKWLNEIFPDCALIAESWEYESRREDLQSLLSNTPYKVFSYRRPRGQTGGCCAIVYNTSKFVVEQLFMQTENGIESVWALMTPRNLDHTLQHVKRVCVSAIYIAPRSRMKVETMDHIIQSIHVIRAKYDNQVNFVIGGDVNRTDFSDVLDSYGALKQCVTVGTRKEATLEIILSDLLNLYHPPTVLGPLEVDKNKAGKKIQTTTLLYLHQSQMQTLK